MPWWVWLVGCCSVAVGLRGPAGGWLRKLDVSSSCPLGRDHAAWLRMTSEVDGFKGSGMPRQTAREALARPHERPEDFDDMEIL